MKSIAALLALSSLVACASAPGTTTETRVAVPVPCRIPDPVCKAPVYDAASKSQPMDTRVRMLRAEIANYEDCVRLYQEALTACRQVEPVSGENPGTR